MPHKPKPPAEWTDEEAMKRLFPKKVRETLKEVAHEKDEPEEPHKDSVSEDGPCVK